MTKEQLGMILKHVTCLDYSFRCVEKPGGVLLLQASYSEKDVESQRSAIQRTRKWYISPHMTESEVVQTCLKCVLTSMEHRAREHFRYMGVQTHNPHFNVQDLMQIALARPRDKREE